MHCDNYSHIMMVNNILDQSHDLYLVLDVKIAGGFVEQKNVRLLCKRTSYDDLLRLAAAKLRNLTQSEPVQFHRVQYALHYLVILFYGAPFDVRLATQQDSIEDCQIVFGVFLWDVSDSSSYASSAEAQYVLIVE